MRPILQPGIQAPPLAMIAVNQPAAISLSDGATQYTVLLFLPAVAPMELLLTFQARLGDLAARNARVVAVFDATANTLTGIAVEGCIGFPLVSDPDRHIAGAYGAVSGDQIAPTAFIIDEEGLIRRVYEPGTGLPNPPALLRAISISAQAPKPPRVTEKDWRLGSPEAPVLLVEYADYQCGRCQELYQVIRRVLSQYPDQVGLVFRHFPLRHSHPLAQLAAEAAEAAGAQGRFWEMHKRLFEANNALEREHLIAYAGEIGLDVTKFDGQLAAGAFRTAVEEDLRGAMGNRIKFPPTLFINGILYEGARTPGAIAACIDGLLACLGIGNSRREMREER